MLCHRHRLIIRKTTAIASLAVPPPLPPASAPPPPVSVLARLPHGASHCLRPEPQVGLHLRRRVVGVGNHPGVTDGGPAGGGTGVLQGRGVDKRGVGRGGGGDRETVSPCCDAVLCRIRR